LGTGLLQQAMMVTRRLGTGVGQRANLGMSFSQNSSKLAEKAMDSVGSSTGIDNYTWFVSDMVKLTLISLLASFTAVQLCINFEAPQKRYIQIGILGTCPILWVFFLTSHGDFGVGWRSHLTLIFLAQCIIGMTAFYLARILSLAVSTAVNRMSTYTHGRLTSLEIGFVVLGVLFVCSQLLGYIATQATNMYSWTLIRIFGIAIAGIGTGGYATINVQRLKNHLEKVSGGTQGERRESTAFVQQNPQAFSTVRLIKLQHRLSRIMITFTIVTIGIAVGCTVAIYYIFAEQGKDSQSYSDELEHEKETYIWSADLAYYAMIAILCAYLYYSWTPLFKSSRQSSSNISQSKLYFVRDILSCCASRDRKTKFGETLSPEGKDGRRSGLNDSSTPPSGGGSSRRQIREARARS